MPLKWIEQAEARQVWVIAMSERMPTPNSPLAATSLKSPLVRLRSWLAAPSLHRDGDRRPPQALPGVVAVRQIRRSDG